MTTKNALNRHYLITSKGFLTVALLFIISTTMAQVPFYHSNCPLSMKQAAIWYFGDKAGVDFRSGTATPLIDQNVMTALHTSSVISDSLGNLLFFTNGNKVWDRSFNLMPNGTGLIAEGLVTQPCLIVPWSGDSSFYYIFTIDAIKFKDSVNYFSDGLCFSVVDMKLRNGLGNVTTSVNQPLLNPVCQKITAVKHKDGIAFWVIAHKWDSDEFYAYLINKAGMNLTPVISATGSFHGGSRKDQSNGYGFMKMSPDGRRLALAISGSNKVELFNFDNETGKVSNAQSFTANIPGIVPYGIEFSPDGNKLYTTLMQILGNGTPTRPSYIYQFDLNKGLTSPVSLDSVSGLRLADLQLAVDGRIYVSRTVTHLVKRDSLDVIYNPNRPGIECNYNLLDHLSGSAFPLAGRYSLYSLPNIVQSFVNIPPFTWDSVCHGNATQFKITNQANTDNVEWDFGDGTPFSADWEPVHTYEKPGKYWVKLSEHFNGQRFTDSVQITSYALPTIAFPSDTILLYTGSSINLHAGGGYTHYTWSTGATDSIISVSNQGNYWAKVEDIHCCTNTDSVFVKVFKYYIPNAFTPNGDGLNDEFKVEGLYRNVKFTITIFDRWGQQIFVSEDIDNGWDGTYRGQNCPSGAYVWKVNVNFIGQDIITQGDIVFKGTVTLVR
ncbi:MAG: gliding motility-associated C-terminal domain-containing protein [Bacteroidales bacterium]|nr:gliding motility-associated C-terminal domain-containing protein [Bacteroidales bacterium]